MNFKTSTKIKQSSFGKHQKLTTPNKTSIFWQKTAKISQFTVFSPSRNWKQNYLSKFVCVFFSDQQIFTLFLPSIKMCQMDLFIHHFIKYYKLSEHTAIVFNLIGIITLCYILFKLPGLYNVTKTLTFVSYFCKMWVKILYWSPDGEFIFSEHFHSITNCITCT
jgi:hypothetical protein